MAFRFHFTAQDLARTRVADATPPLAELGIALRVLQDRQHSVHLRAWRHEVIPRLPRHARMVLDLVPTHGRSPGFLLPEEVRGVPELLEQVTATPARRLRANLAVIAEQQALPGWARRLGEDPDVLRQLVSVLQEVHAVALAPYWSQVVAANAADAAVRARDVVFGGLERLLSGLYPRRIRWRAPVLEVDSVTGRDADVHLDGRGLLLMPSVFTSKAPLVSVDDEPQPILIYPAIRGSAASPLLFMPRQPMGSEALPSLTALLGRTRAAALTTIARNPGCTTSTLAALMGTGQSGASQHATILREAGLIATVRRRNTALHTLTAAGTALLDAAADDDQ